MTSTAKILWTSDIKEAKSYFSSQTISKILIALAFILIFSGLEFIIYQVARQYLYIIRSSRDYAFITADYILRSIILLLFWLGIGSSTISTIGFFLNKNKNLAYLLTLPLDIVELIAWHLSKTILLNTLLLSIILCPVLLVFERGFIRGFGLSFYLCSLALLLALSAITSTIGGLLGSLMVKISSRPNLLISLLGSGVFLAILVLLFNFVFPTSLYRLAQATPLEFNKIYSALPLSASWIPTNWLTGLFTTREQNYWLATQILSIALVILYLKFQEKTFLKTYLKISAIPVLDPSDNVIQVPFENLSPIKSLLAKDLTQLFRSPGEPGYAAFLFFLLLLFFGLFSKARIETDLPKEWINMFRTFGFLGLAFFTNTFLLRMAFPAMAREGEALWYLFTLPLSRHRLWWSKLIFVLLMSTPFAIMSLVSWPILNFMSGHYFLFAISSFAMVIIIALCQGLLGLIKPNFSESNSPEKISTSFMGILTLVITTTLTILMAIGINLSLAKSSIGPTIIIASLAASFLAITFLTIVSRSELDNYKF